MPVSRFDVSPENRYVSQYVPLPFEAIGALGEKIQKKQDTAIDDTYKLKDLMTKVPAIYDPNLGLSNIQKKKELDAQFAPKIDELSNRIVAGDPNAYRELEQVKRDFINNPIRQELEESYLNYKAYKEDVAKKGDAYAIYKDPYRNKALITQTGDLEPFRYSGMGERQDHASEARAQMADIAKMGYDSKNSYLDPNDGNIYTKDSHGKYVKDTRVRELANMKADKFIQTQKGLDYLQLLHYQNPKATPQELMQGVSDYLYTAGANQVFADIGGGTGIKTTALTLSKDQEKKIADIITTNEQGNPEAVNMATALKGLGIDDVLDAKGDYITKQTTKGTTVTGPGLMNAPIFGKVISTVLPGKSAEQIVNEGFAKLAEKSKELGLPAPLDGNYRKQLYDYATEIAKRRSTTSKLQQSTAEGLNKAILGPNSDISNMEFYLQGDEGSNAKMTAEKAKDIPKNSRFTSIDFFGPNQAGWKLAVSNKDDSGNILAPDQAYLAVPKDKTFEEETRAVHTISRGALEFAKTGKTNSKYIDSEVKQELQSKLNKEYKSAGWGNAPELIATSYEKNHYGNSVMMGTYVDNSSGTPEFKAVTYTVKPNGIADFRETSLDALQADKTTELQVKGSLKQYNTNLKETIKPSDIVESEDATE